MAGAISKSGIGGGGHKKGLSGREFEESQAEAGEQFGFGRDYQNDKNFWIVLKYSKSPYIALILRSKHSKPEKMDMGCIPGKIIGH
jgi:hypothetical protein